MSLDEVEKCQLISELEDFHKQLAEYGGLASKLSRSGKITALESRLFHNLRQEVLRSYGGLKLAIEKYGGRAIMLISGRERDAFCLATDISLNEHVFTALQRCLDTLNIAIGNLQRQPLSHVEAQDVGIPQCPKAFIAHGGKSPALTKLCDFLSALGVKPLVVEDEPSEGRSIGEQVKWCLDRCDCAIVLATKGDIDGNTGEFIPRGNVLNEIGRFQEKFSSRIVYLIESGTKFPTNISEKVRERFKPQSMDKAFIKVAKELTAFGHIKAVKPE